MDSGSKRSICREHGQPFLPCAWAWWERSEARRFPAEGFTPSIAIGVAQLFATSCKSGPPAPGRSARREFGPPVMLFGVGQSRAWPFKSNSFARAPLRCILPPVVSATLGVCHTEDEQPLPPMRRARLSRAEYSARNPVARSFEISLDASIAHSQVSCDVFEEHDSRLYFSNNPKYIGPQVAFIALAKALSSEAERLARVSRRDEIHDPAPRSAIEGLEIVPDRSPIQGRVFHPRHESGRGVGVPLDVTHNAVGVSKGEVQPEVDASNPGT